MVKVVVNDNKGLVQYGGQSGLEIGNAITGAAGATGVEFIKYGAVQSLNAANDYDDELVLPAGAMITDISVVFLTLCATADTADDKVAVKVGFSAGGTDLINDIEVLIRNKTAVAGAMQSIVLGNKVEASSTVFPAFADAELLRDAAGAARSIHTRFVVEDAALGTPGTARSFVKYIVI